MIITILETKFDVGVPKETMLSMKPIQDIHAIEEQKARLDKINMPYALAECRKVTKKTDVFLGWSLITQLPLW